MQVNADNKSDEIEKQPVPFANQLACEEDSPALIVAENEEKIKL